jgi:hypothetical protein
MCLDEREVASDVAEVETAVGIDGGCDGGVALWKSPTFPTGYPNIAAALPRRHYRGACPGAERRLQPAMPARNLYGLEQSHTRRRMLRPNAVSLLLEKRAPCVQTCWPALRCVTWRRRPTLPLGVGALQGEPQHPGRGNTASSGLPQVLRRLRRGAPVGRTAVPSESGVARGSDDGSRRLTTSASMSTGKWERRHDYAARN